MAKITEFYIEFGQTVNMGDYNSASCRFGTRVSLEPNDNPEIIKQQLIRYVKGDVGRQIRQVESQYNQPAWEK
jgi:hypothetical protein